MGHEVRAVETGVIARLDRAIQCSRDGAAGTEGPRRTGCPAFAGHDSGVRGASRARHLSVTGNCLILQRFPSLALSFGTTLERIAAESLTPLRFRIRSRNMSRDVSGQRTRWSFVPIDKR